MKKIFVGLLCLSCLIAPVWAQTYLGLTRDTIGTANVTDYRYALDLDGNNDYVVVPDSDTLDCINLTLSFWMNVTNWSQNSYGRIFTHKNGWADNQGFEIQYYPALKRFEVIGSGASAQSGVYDVGPTWTQIALWINGTTAKIYANASEVLSFTIDAVVASTRNVGIGAYPSGASEMTMMIDHILYFDRLLNSTEITHLYNGTNRHSPLNSTDLAAFWRFNEGSGTNITDSSGNGNHGTLTGDGDEWITGYIPYNDLVYPSTISVSNLQENYNCTLFDGSILIDSDVVDASGDATLTLPFTNRTTTFEGSFKIYDTSNNHVFTTTFDDTRGGDTYRAMEEMTKGFLLAAAVIVLFIGAFLVILLWRRR